MKLTVNTKFIKIAPLEPTLYRVSIPMRLLEYTTKIMSNNSIKQNQKLGSTINNGVQHPESSVQHLRPESRNPSMSFNDHNLVLVT